MFPYDAAHFNGGNVSYMCLFSFFKDTRNTTMIHPTVSGY